MTTPNIEELIAKLSYYSGDGVQIDMARQAQRQAADALQSQAERIKVLELDLDVQAGSIDAAKGVNARQAERIKALEGQLDDATAAARSDQMIAETAQAAASRLLTERDNLRAQLNAIAATEPVAIALNTGTRQAVKWLQNIPHGEKLYTRPMPVQSADHCLWARNGHEPCQHVKPMQDVTELVEAVTCLLQLIRREAPQLSGKVMGFAETALSKYKGAK